MTTRKFCKSLTLLLAVVATASFGRSTFAQFGGPGGPGGFNGPTREVLDQFDKNGDKRLNAEERKAAREALGTAAAEQDAVNVRKTP